MAYCDRRFGAEDLFKAAEEGAAERSKQLLEEDIESILQRAEVVQQGPGAVDAPANGVAAELLSSFNVATFKVGGQAVFVCACFACLHCEALSWFPGGCCRHHARRTCTSTCTRPSSSAEASAAPLFVCVCCCRLLQNEEDDATFWSRLIREDDRPAEQEEQEVLLPRAARLAAAGAAAGSSLGPRSRSSTPLGALSDAEADAEPAAARGKVKKAKAGGKKKQHGGGSEPGPPVEGAVLRVDEWLLDVHETGRSLPKQVSWPLAYWWPGFLTTMLVCAVA